MKKFLCVALCLSLVVSTAMFTGCGGSGGGGGFFSYFSAAIVIAVVATSAGAASPITFAASSREGIRGSTKSDKYEAVLYIDDVKTETTNNILVDGKKLKLENPFTANVSKENVEYKVVFRKKGNEVGLTIIGTATNISQGETNPIGSEDAPIEATVETTAEALVYEKWKAEVSNKSFQDFQIVKLVSEINTVKAAVEKDLDTVFKDKHTTFPTADSAADTAADNTPAGVTSVEVPAEKSTTKDISKLHHQVELAISESLKTALNNLRISAQPSTIRATTMTEAVPGFGSNNLVNPEKMMSLLLSALPTGGNIQNGPSLHYNTEDQLATWTASTRTLEVTNFRYKGPSRDERYISKTIVIKKVKSAEVEDGVLLKMAIESGANFEIEEYNSNGEVDTKHELTIVEGLEISTDYNISVNDEPEFVALYPGGTSGKSIYATGTEKYTITFKDPARFEVKLTEDNKTSNVDLKISNLSGSYVFSQDFSHYKYAWSNSSTSEFGSFMKNYDKTLNSRTNKLVFTDNKLAIDVSLIWPNEGVILEKGKLTVPVGTKISTAETKHDLKYPVNDATGEFKIRYAGDDYEKYGYINTLDIDVTGINYNPESDNISDGEATVTKTNTDQTVETLKYKVVNGKAILQQADSTKFAGGNEKIEENGNETIISGTVNFTSNEPTSGSSMSVNYKSTRDNTTKDVTTRAVVTYGTAVKTLFFKWYYNEGINVNEPGKVFEGNKATDDDTDSYATFTVYSSGGLLSIPGEDSYHFAVDF